MRRKSTNPHKNAECFEQNFSRKTLVTLSRSLNLMPLIRHLRNRCSRGRADVERELEYFRKNRSRMRYRALQDRNLPIGSGVVRGRKQKHRDQKVQGFGHAMEHGGRPGDHDFPGTDPVRPVRPRVERSASK